MKKLSKKTMIILAVVLVLAVGGITALAVGLSAGRSVRISEEEAKAAAFAHAGLEESQILSLQVGTDRDDGRTVYEIDFRSADRSYSYEVSARTGEILRSSYDTLQSGEVQAAQESTAQIQETETAAQTQESSAAGAGAAISEEEARAAALADAGLQESDVEFIRIQEDRDDGFLVYEVEFYAGGTEYDYTIDRSTGQILKKDFDMESYFDGANGEIISREEAMELALARVEGASEENIRIQLDRDDGRQIYEGEILYGQTEYEFEIDASTGDFIEWSMDYRD